MKAFLVLFCIILSLHAIQFDVEPATKRCIQQDFTRGQIIHGTYKVPQVPVMQMSLKILPPEKDAEPIYQVPDANEGSYAFTAVSDGLHKFCFSDKPREGMRDRDVGKAVTRRVTLTAKEAWVAPQEDEATVEKAELLPVEQRFVRIENRIENLKAEVREFRSREARHRDTSESTALRIPTFSGVTIVVLIICGGLQMWYLKNFFRKKKLL